MRNIAVSKYNTNDKDGAHQDFIDAVASGKKAVEALEKRSDEKDYPALFINYHEILAETEFILGERYQDQEALKDCVANFTILTAKYSNDSKKASSTYVKLGDSYRNLSMTMSTEEGAPSLVNAKAAYDKAVSLNQNNAKAYLGMVALIANDPNADVAKFKEGVEVAKKAKNVAEANSADAHQAEEFIKNLEDVINSSEASKKTDDSKNTKKKKP